MRGIVPLELPVSQLSLEWVWNEPIFTLLCIIDQNDYLSLLAFNLFGSGDLQHWTGLYLPFLAKLISY